MLKQSTQPLFQIIISQSTVLIQRPHPVRNPCVFQSWVWTFTFLSLLIDPFSFNNFQVTAIDLYLSWGGVKILDHGKWVNMLLCILWYRVEMYVLILKKDWLDEYSKSLDTTWWFDICTSSSLTLLELWNSYSQTNSSCFAFCTLYFLFLM